MADGIANILMFIHLTDTPRQEDYPAIMVRFSFLKDLLIKAMMPFYLLWLTIDLVGLRKADRNGYKSTEVMNSLTTKKNVKIVPDIPTDLVKKRAKELTTPEQRITFNDVLITALSKTIKDYLNGHTSDKTTDSVTCACPFSLRPPPQTLGDFEFNNNFAIVALKLRLVNSIKEGIRQISRDMDSIKKSIEPIGLSYLIKIIMQLPEFARAYILEDFCDKMTFGFSNVPGPKHPYCTAGYRTQALGFIMPVGKSICGSFSVISHVDVIKMCVTMDQATMKSVEPFVEILMKNLDEVLGTTEWRNYQKTREIK